MTPPLAKKQKMTADEEYKLEDSRLDEQHLEENQPHPDRFSALPAELRNAVYAQVLAHPHFFLVAPGEQTSQGPFGLLGVTRQIREDFRGMLRTAVQEHEWVFDNATAFSTMLRVAPRWVLQDITRLRLRFSAAEAFQFWNGGTGNRHEDPETSCVGFNWLTGLQYLEVNFRRDEEEEDFYDSYGGYDDVLQGALGLMEPWAGDLEDESLGDVQLTGHVSDGVIAWAREEGIVDEQESEEQDDEQNIE